MANALEGEVVLIQQFLNAKPLCIIQGMYLGQNLLKDVRL